MAMAMIKPPIKRKINGFAKGVVASAIGEMSSTGNSTMGISAVAAIGIASEIHHAAINKATAAVFQAEGSRPSGAGSSRTIKKRMNPRYKPSRDVSVIRLNITPVKFKVHCDVDHCQPPNP